VEALPPTRGGDYLGGVFYKGENLETRIREEGFPIKEKIELKTLTLFIP